MEPKTVSTTVQAGLCCGCGICKGSCPKGCISWNEKDGLYVPKIDTQSCIQCSLCVAVCPGLGHSYERAGTAADTAAGWDSSNAPKSRYLPVSHETAIAYIKSHRDARLILVGTSCAIRGLQAAIKKLNLSI